MSASRLQTREPELGLPVSVPPELGLPVSAPPSEWWLRLGGCSLYMLTAALAAGPAFQDCLAGYLALRVYIALPKAPHPQRYGVVPYHVGQLRHVGFPTQGRVALTISH